MLLVYGYLLKCLAPDPDENSGGGKQEEGKNQKGDKGPEQQSEVALAKALREARENSVPKAEFERLKKEKEDLVSEIINGKGTGSGQPQPEEQKPTIAELKEKLYGPKCSELSNLEYWKNTLALRRAVIDKGDPDPFLPIGSKISPTKEDIEKAQNVDDVVQQCIDECDGNSEVFTALLQSRTNNDSPALTLRLAKLGVKYK